MPRQLSMFSSAETTPLFSQSPQRVRAQAFRPGPAPTQLHIGGCPICEATGLVVPRPGAEAQYCICQHGDRERQIDRQTQERSR